MKTIEDTWLKLKSGLIEELPEKVVDDLCKKNFYAGAVAAHYLIGLAALENDPTHLQAITDELHRHRDDLEKAVMD